MSWYPAALLLGIGVAVAACGGGSSVPKATSTTASPATTATVSQYASEIARLKHQATALDDIQDCLDPSTACVLTVLSVQAEAETLRITLDGLQHDRAGNKLYVGPPPAEIANLVQQTYDDAREATTTARITSESCTATACAGLGAVRSAAHTLTGDYAAWAPYGA